MCHLENACKSSIKSAREDLARKISISQKQIIKAYVTQWKERFPKRKIELKAGMGTLFFVVDGNILHIDYDLVINSQGAQGYRNFPSASWEGWKNYGIAHDRGTSEQKVFWELVQAYHFINETLESGEYIDHYLSDMKF